MKLYYISFFRLFTIARQYSASWNKLPDPNIQLDWLAFWDFTKLKKPNHYRKYRFVEHEHMCKNFFENLTILMTETGEDYTVPINNYVRLRD